jgi:fructose-1,6-bisphosphatase I
MFVYTTGEGVNGFTLDPSIGEFILSHPDLKIPERGRVYSANEGYIHKWDKNIVEYVNALKMGKTDSEKPHKARYIGSLIADFHRNMLYGGVFLYPADINNPNGKLRLLFEANPLSFIAEEAGGMAIDGKHNILNIKPKELHQRVPLFIGSKNDINLLKKLLKD